MAELILGIDLGTTNSLVSYYDGQTSRLIPNRHGDILTPSCVSCLANGNLVVGKPARDRLVSHPSQTASSFKRYMGSSKTYRLGKRDYKPEELSALILQSLKEDASEALGQTIDRAVITVPAYFRDPQRSATRLAGELAGFKVERIINEPTAAALAYNLHNRDVDTKVLVLDLGGGTFDVSVLEMFNGVVEVKASTGDNFLGGEDFLDILVKHFTELLKQNKYPSKIIDSPEFQSVLRAKSETIKHSLSDKPDASAIISIDDNPYELRITGEQYASLCEPLLNRLRIPIERAIRDSQLRMNEIGEVLLVGGATRLQIVRQLATTLIGRFPSITLPPDEAIAIGAGVMAGMRSRDANLKEMVLTDVAPFSLGIETGINTGAAILNGIFSPIIERNTPIPISIQHEFSPLSASQKVVDVKIFQGESRKVSDNIFLGKLVFPIPRNRPDRDVLPTFSVRFSYDLNGLLEVDVNDATGTAKKLLIEESPGKLSKSEVETAIKKLQALKIDPREDAENRVLLTRAERLFAESLSDLRVAIGNFTAEFESILARQIPSEIEKARISFSSQLDEIEKKF